jgi:hypothetical protein
VNTTLIVAHLLRRIIFIFQRYPWAHWCTLPLRYETFCRGRNLALEFAAIHEQQFKFLITVEVAIFRVIHRFLKISSSTRAAITPILDVLGRPVQLSSSSSSSSSWMLVYHFRILCVNFYHATLSLCHQYTNWPRISMMETRFSHETESYFKLEELGFQWRCLHINWVRYDSSAICCTSPLL